GLSTGGAVGAWRTYEPLPGVRQFHALENIGGKLCVLGGSSGSLADPKVFVSTFAGTEYYAQAADNTGFAGAVDSAWAPDHSWRPSGLVPDTDYYFRARSRNWAGRETAYSNYLTTHTYAAVPAVSTWSAVYQSSAVVSWGKNGNPGGVKYYCEISSYTDYSFVNSYTGLADYAEFSSLTPSTTYYARVRAVDSLLRMTAFLELAPFRTLFDAALDVSSPTVTDNQAGLASWRKDNSALYDVDFADAGGTNLSSFSVRAATDPGGAGGILTPWTLAADGIGQAEYTADWALPLSVWNAIQEGVTAYISVRVEDNVRNSTEVADVFYVLKDTTPPSLSLSYVPPSGWVIEYPGPVSSAAFSDLVSGLSSIEYSASANKGSGDGGVISWTAIASVSGYSVFTATWSYDFSRLANGASNYFSLRATDLAGNESAEVGIDTFTIMKNVSGPVVSISTPSYAFLSTITYISGYNTETDGRPVVGTELSVRDRTAGLYWNGSAFLSGSRVWHVAAGTYPFVLNVSLPLTDGHRYEAAARSSDTAGDYS
ncbi:MAG TPA: hypothetical protein PL037_07720, partial [Elusimicrobiales bacterium]|nr:hypothetical protein [Elusimicrobiales bacterium]